MCGSTATHPKGGGSRRTARLGKGGTPPVASPARKRARVGAVCPHTPENIWAEMMNTKKTKSGSENRQRQKYIRLRVTDTEKTQIDTRAQKAGLYISGFLRVLIFGPDTPQPRAVRRPSIEVEEVVKLRYELRKIGGNLNQIAHQLNQGKTPPPEILATAMEEHIAAARAVLAVLSGHSGDGQ